MKIIIIGCGRIGSRLVQALSLLGHTVTVIDKDPFAFERLGTVTNVHTITGIGFDREVLEQAGIKGVDALAAVTSSDEANLIVARLAKKIFHVPRVAAFVYDPRKAEIYHNLDLLTVSSVSLGVNRMVEYITTYKLNLITGFGSGEVDILEAEIQSNLAGRSVKDLTIPGKIHVITISRGGKTFLPDAETTIQKGDHIHFAFQVAFADRLNELLDSNGEKTK